ncbi:hypothetical protein EV426DRAFT_347948 [Tirmania nivea]|nr:hypothetical protein EV426DRAFT_347948 [Tirmania nivea]
MQVEQTAKENEEKVAEALRLLQRVDELVESHTTTAASLTTFLNQLSTLPSALSQANDLAQSIHTQLTTLSALISTEESALESSHLISLQSAEDQKFSAYAVDRRAALERKKEEYARQLDGFRKERLGLVREGGGNGGEGGLGLVVKSSSRSNNPSVTRRVGGGSGIAASPLGMGLESVPGSYATQALGLEHVTLTEVEGGELESFFSEQQEEEGQSRSQPWLPSGRGSIGSSSGDGVIPRPRTVPPVISSSTSSRPQTPISIQSPPQRKLQSPLSSSLPASLPAPLPKSQPHPHPPPPAVAGAGVIAADEDFDADSDAVALLYGSTKKKKKKGSKKSKEGI